jgi:acetyl-CoA synthetase
MGLDLQPGGHVLCWMTDMGWMMGPWVVFGALLQWRSTMVLYDGAPDFPDVDQHVGGWWTSHRDHRTWGSSPTLFRALMQFWRRAGAPPRPVQSLQACLASTGEPWNPAPWLWLFNTVGGGRCPIINYSGGTEISGGIVMGNVMLPLKPCAFSGPVAWAWRRRGG